MKIGSKIALFYTLISVLTTVIIIAVFYIFSTQYINKLYASYLREKAYLTAQKHWEKDEVDEQSYQIIQRKYDELLPEAHEILLNMDSLSEVRDTLNKYLTQHQQALLLAGQDSIPFSFKYKDQLGAALYYPDNEGNFIVLVMSRNAYGTEIKEHLLLLSIFLILASSVLIFFIGKIYSGRILVPLQHILKELKRIRANSLNRRLKTTGNNDELEDMIKTLNSMLDRLDSAFKAEKSFVSHASHELNNPITAIQGECEISLLKERSTGEYIESLQRISSESKRLSSLIRHLLFLSRHAFFVLYANIDNFDATKYSLEYDKLAVMDKWLLSRLESTVKAVDDNLANYRIPEAAKALQSFVDDMSNWYVRRSRERFWAKGMEQDKINAYMTLYTALVTVAKAAAPMIPFMTEDIYQNLVKSIDASAPESIHLCDFPEVHENWIDPKMEEDMADLLEIVVMGRAARNTANIKNRQPIGTMYVKSEFQLSEFYKEIIEDELNVKEVVFKDDIADFISYSFKPQMRTVGPKYGKLLNKIKTVLSELDGNKAMAELKSTGELKLDIDGQEIVLLEEDLLIDMAQMEGYVSESDHTITVVLDTNLTPELIEEGFVRELVSKIQTMRKEAGFEVMDKIRVYAKDNDKIVDIMKNHGDEIKSEVLAEDIVTGETKGYEKEWNINSEKVTMAVERI